MSEVTSQPLLYQMGLAVGQSMAMVSERLRGDLQYELDAFKENAKQPNEEIERMRLSMLLGLDLF